MLNKKETHKSEFQVRLEKTLQEVKKLVEDNLNTHYVKMTQDKDGNITSLGVYAHAEAEKKAFEYCFGFSIEDVQVVSALTEKQRKLILLQSQKENLEKEIQDLLKK